MRCFVLGLLHAALSLEASGVDHGKGRTRKNNSIKATAYDLTEAARRGEDGLRPTYFGHVKRWNIVHRQQEEVPVILTLVLPGSEPPRDGPYVKLQDEKAVRLLREQFDSHQHGILETGLTLTVEQSLWLNNYLREEGTAHVKCGDVIKAHGGMAGFVITRPYDVSKFGFIVPDLVTLTPADPGFELLWGNVKVGDVVSDGVDDEPVPEAYRGWTVAERQSDVDRPGEGSSITLKLDDLYFDLDHSLVDDRTEAALKKEVKEDKPTTMKPKVEFQIAGLYHNNEAMQQMHMARKTVDRAGKQRTSVGMAAAVRVRPWEQEGNERMRNQGLTTVQTKGEVRRLSLATALGPDFAQPSGVMTTGVMPVDASDAGPHHTAMQPSSTFVQYGGQAYTAMWPVGFGTPSAGPVMGMAPDGSYVMMPPPDNTMMMQVPGNTMMMQVPGNTMMVPAAVNTVMMPAPVDTMMVSVPVNMDGPWWRRESGTGLQEPMGSGSSSPSTTVLRDLRHSPPRGPTSQVSPSQLSPGRSPMGRWENDALLAGEEMTRVWQLAD